MSRIGNASIVIPDKVKVSVQGQQVNVEGPKGKLQFTTHNRVSVETSDKTVVVKRKGESRQDKALHGLTRALVANMVKGAHEGFRKKLEIQGVGFRAAVQGKSLNLNLGKSHPIAYPIPADVKITVEDNTNILLEGVDKQRVGAVAADIRRYYPPEPYKGKGVRYAGEQIRRKEGKTAQSK
jgi:large subunit ribosomal protein L6